MREVCSHCGHLLKAERPCECCPTLRVAVSILALPAYEALEAFRRSGEETPKGPTLGE